ncbi:MAG: peptidase MA family metallohydrolase [Bacillota bacterium]
MLRAKKNWLTAALWLVTPLLLGAVLVTSLRQPQAAVYNAVRDVNRWRTTTSLRGYEALDGTHFTVWYTQQDANIAPMILRVAEDLYPALVKQVHFAPAERVQLVVYPDRGALRQAFGWSDQESALGVYYGGTIRLLSPNVWAGTNDPAELERAFRELGPISHEFTHLALDYRTSGNYPHWFSEGLAQWVERRTTGYLWLEPDNRLNQPRYSLTQLDRDFDRLPNVAMAYREAYLMVDFLAQQGGDDSVGALVDRLAAGQPFAEAVEAQYGIAWDRLDGLYQNWLDQNQTKLDAQPLS